MARQYTLQDVMAATAAAAELLSIKKDDINKLNVFPVPDGDTGTNMALTLRSVVENVATLPESTSNSEYRRAVITGALMGARGNSGVITSQILRGLCEGSEPFDVLNTECLATSFAKATEVAFQAVRKPVQGTILTVLQDSAAEAERAHAAGLSIDDAMNAVVNEAFASVERTPDFLPVLKEHNVVDAGGFGLAILFEGFASFLQGKVPADIGLIAQAGQPKVEIEHIDDWEGSQYRYCNEFLVDSVTLNPEEALDFLSTIGDCELCVGSSPKFKVHVHSNHPDQVLKYFLDRGQVFEVFIHNMDLQSRDRAQKIASEHENAVSTDNFKELKPLGFVAVAAGSGNEEILKSLGVDVVVCGGQTMNPSTKDILEAIEKVPASSVIVLPDNSNIIMAASSACELSTKECVVVPTVSVLEGIAAMFASNPEDAIAENVEAMESAVQDVSTGEVTTAVKPSKDKYGNPISEGDVIGIANGEIEVIGQRIADVTLSLLDKMNAQDKDTLTLLGGASMTDDELNKIVQDIEQMFDEIDIDAHIGGQPLYPIIFSLE